MTSNGKKSKAGRHACKAGSSRSSVRRHARELFDRASIRRALKKWHKLPELGTHALADLEIVEAGRKKGRYPDSPRGYGGALRQVLRQAIQKLKPKGSLTDDGEPPYPLNQRWGPYIILTEQYTNTPRRRRKELQQIWGIAPGTFPSWQNKGLDDVGNTLWQWEQELAKEHVSEGKQPQVPFMAPPQPDYTLIGRTPVLDGLKKRLFAAQSVALTALNGLPGVGKTALAITLAHDADVRAHFPDGVLWVGLGRQPDILTLLTVWGMALGIPASEMGKFSSIEDRAKVIYSAIGERKMLLVIDDAWQIKDSLAFRLGGPNCVHLLTTRQPEMAWEFAQEGTSKINELNEDDSLTLLSQFVPQLVTAYREEVRDVVKKVGGLPLALILIGRYLQKSLYFDQDSTQPDLLQPLQDLDTRLSLSLSLSPLDKQPSLPFGVPLSLLASIEISDSALNQPARQMLRALSTFPPKPNSFSEEAALAVSKLPAKTLLELTGAGLLEPSGPERYTMHQAIADYARFKNPEPDLYYRNGARYFAHFAQQNRHSDGYPLLDADLQNILTFLPSAHQNQEWHTLLKGVQGLTYYHLGVVGFMDARGHWNQATQLLEQALEGARTLDDPLLDASILSKQAAFAFRRSDFESAKGQLEASHAILSPLPRSEKVVLQRAYMYEFRSMIALRDNPQAALEWAEQAIRELEAFLVESNVIKEQTGYLYVWSSTIFGRTGQFQKALEIAEKGLSLLPSSANSAQIVAFIVLSNVSAFQGEIEKSIEYQEKGIQIAEELGDLRRLASLCMNLANNQGTRQSNFVTALVSYQKALQLHQQLGNFQGESDVQGNLGLIYLMLGADELALRYLTNAMQLAETHGLLRQEAFASTNLANLLIYQEQLVEALALLNQADQIGQQLELTELLPIVWYWQAEIARINGEHDQALRLINASLEKAKKGGYFLEEGIGWSIKGKILDETGHFDQAEAAHQESLRLLKEQQSPYHLAQSQLAVGEHYLMRDKHLSDDAKSWLTKALATFEGLGAKREIAIIGGLLGE